MKPLVGPVLGTLLLVATASSAVAQPLNLNVKKAAPAADKACFTTKGGNVICLAGPIVGVGTGVEGHGSSAHTGPADVGGGTAAGGVGGHSAYNPPPTLRDIRKDLDRYISERRELPS